MDSFSPPPPPPSPHYHEKMIHFVSKILIRGRDWLRSTSSEMKVTYRLMITILSKAFIKKIRNESRIDINQTKKQNKKTTTTTKNDIYNILFTFSLK